jgi:hypothetical protein
MGMGMSSTTCKSGIVVCVYMGDLLKRYLQVKRISTGIEIFCSQIILLVETHIIPLGIIPGGEMY